MAGARGIDAQGKKLGVLLHRGIRMRLVIERITLTQPGNGAVFERQSLVTGFIGFLRWTLSLEAPAFWCLIRFVVGVGLASYAS
jgi:hypothetical protein